MAKVHAAVALGFALPGHHRAMFMPGMRKSQTIMPDARTGPCAGPRRLATHWLKITLTSAEGESRDRVHTSLASRARDDTEQIFDAADGLYVDPVFRPPAEANSIILQVTNGCSWNRCLFCEMYTAEQKKFRAKPLDEIEADLRILAAIHKLQQTSCAPPRVFLADGDAMSLPVGRLQEILARIREALPDVARVTSYCLPRNLRGKSIEDLASMRKQGLRTLYVGCESGDDEVLARVGKGETYESSLAALRKIKAAGLKASIMILHGLGGKQLSGQHARHSAALASAAQPDFLSTLVVSFPLGSERHASGFEDLPGGMGFLELTPQEVLEEMTMFMEGLELERTIFRSDHASNYLALQGVLGRDKKRLLLELAEARAGRTALRPEWLRGL